MAGIIDAAMKSPDWARIALFFTCDEHGEFHDHVPPLAACPPYDIRPIPGPANVPEKFGRPGVRVPMIVVQPVQKTLRIA